MKTLYSSMTIILLFVSNVSVAQIALTNEIQAANDNETLATSEELPVLAVRYFYFPNLDAYYDTKTSLYIYEDKGEWVQAPQIASGYRGYSIYNGTNVPITDYNGDKPFTKLDEHQKLYPKKYSSKRLPPKMKEESKLAVN